MKRQTILNGFTVFLFGVFSLAVFVPAGSLSAQHTPQHTYVLSVQELNQGLQKSPSLREKGFFLIDVRTEDEHQSGFIPGTDHNIDFRVIARRHREIGARFDDHIVVYCQSGRRSNIAAETLAGLGYQYVYNVAGSMNAWNEAGYPVASHRR